MYALVRDLNYFSYTIQISYELVQMEQKRKKNWKKA